MCTVTYVPKSDGFILTSNRDELDNRGTLKPENYIHEGKKLFYPKDEVALGTWIALSENNRVACLLNGAFGKHKRNLPYRKSRGLVVLESLLYDSSADFLANVDLKNIEPFTLVLLDSVKGKINLVELKWDGINKHVKHFNTEKPHIWSSPTLYPSDIAQKKMLWFEEFIEKKNTPEDLIKFHQSKRSDNAKENVMADFGNGLRTISTTQIVLCKDSIDMNYIEY